MKDHKELNSVQSGTRALSSGSLDGSLTGHGDMLGTPGYMPVEQIYNEEVDARSDQFS